MANPEQFEGLIIIKIGTSTLTQGGLSIDQTYIADLCKQISALREQGRPVAIVTSGAAAAGRKRLGIAQRPTDIPTLQACASAGQAVLTELYATELARCGIPCGQVLLTRRDLVSREGYLNARNTLFRLLDLGAVPVINENDTVSVSEFNFGDNDMLGAIVAALLGASLYVILSDVEGLYTANPTVDSSAELLREVESVDKRIAKMAGESGTDVGTGGMASKIRAARAMLAAGIPLVICQGRRKNVVLDIVEGKQVGTRFAHAGDAVTHGSGRKLWIGLAEVPKGELVVDRGAARAVVERGASLLPVGVCQTRGSYVEGDVVRVLDGERIEIARGVVRYSSEDMERIQGLKLDIVGRFLKGKEGEPAIHRDEMLVF